MIQEDKKGFCPRLKQDCIGERCHFWTSIKYIQPARVAGAINQLDVTGCQDIVSGFLLNMIANNTPPIALRGSRS